MQTHLFLQARMGSKRLPGKVLLRIQGKSIIELIIERLRRVQGADKIVVLTGPRDGNEALVKEVERLGVEVFCGSEENVLDRYYQASLVYKPDIIVRLNADCPLVDPLVVSKAISAFQEGEYDVLKLSHTYPYGVGFEIFSQAALERAWKHEGKREQESPAEYMLKARQFKQYVLPRDVDHSHVRLALDYPEDFELIEKIYGALYGKNPRFTMEDVLQLLEDDAQLVYTGRNI